MPAGSLAPTKNKIEVRICFRKNGVIDIHSREEKLTCTLQTILGEFWGNESPEWCGMLLCHALLNYLILLIFSEIDQKNMRPKMDSKLVLSRVQREANVAV